MRTMTKPSTLLRLAIIVLLSIATLPMAAQNSNQLPGKIEDGVILHCFEWKFTDIQAELANIAAAGFNAIQTSPVQPNWTTEQTSSHVWYDVYRPWGFRVATTALGTKEQLQSLITAAHSYGIKVIVDVVANHTVSFNDTEWSKLDSYWKDISLYHERGGVWNYSDREAVTQGDISMHDIKTELPANQAEIKKLITELKGMGVDGIRWDAAKHIGLPSEGDNFWATVPDQSMFNYGEILGQPANGNSNLFNEYLQYMSVTDDRYSTNKLLASFKNGNVPNVASVLGAEINTKKMVYWGESHDTYCNTNAASVGVDQNVIDRAYAVAASHNGIPALYLSRPNGGTNAQMGVKGSTHFMDAEVAEVNKFHNKLAGQEEAYATSNGVASSCRQGGAILVKGNGSGSVTAVNAEGKTATGTYKDAISGNEFKVTSSQITGTIGSTGIAVLYPTETVPEVVLSPNGGDFYTTSVDVTATLFNGTSASVKVGNGEKQTFTATKTINIGSDIAAGQSVTVSWEATDGTKNNTGSATFTKKEFDPSGVKLYFSNPSGWETVNVYLYADNGSTNNGWPGEGMTKVDNLSVNGVTGTWWVFSVPDAYLNGQFIVNNGNSGSGNQSPTGAGININNKSQVLTSVEASPTTTEATDVKIDNGEEDDLQGDYFDVPQGVSYDYSGKDYCYFEAPSGWDQANIWAWNGNVNLYSAWPGAVLTEVGQAENGNKVYKWVNDTNTTPANLIFSNNGNTQTDAGGFTYTKGGYYNFDGYQGTVEELTGLFNRVFTKDERSTVCLPFNIKTSEMGSLNGKLYELTNYENGYLIFEQTYSATAFQPYIFVANATERSFHPFKEKTISDGTGAEVAADIFTFCGNMSRQVLVSDASSTFYGYSVGSFVQAGTTSGISISPYRAYFKKAASNNAPLINILLADEDATALNQIQTAMPSPTYYNIAGMKAGNNISSLKKGIYIAAGKKFVVR